MCGIEGLVFLDRDPGLVARGAELIRKMTGALRHRGPDDEGHLAVDSGTGEATELWGSDSALKRGADIEDFRGPADVLLGHRRLAVLDPSPAGHQPMPYAGGRYWVVYNGEIFNWLELRGELASLGYEFRTGTDTEVLLAAYHAWGTNCVRRFIGDWAFCLYDVAWGRLFFSRDRVGVRFLYWYRDDRVFAFASEIKALFALPFVPRRWNYRMLANFLVSGLSDYSAETMFADVYQLEPGQNLLLDPRSGEVRVERYHRFEANGERARFEPAAARRFAAGVRELLEDAVALRLRADVPVGTCLSGGLDSSTVVAIINKLLREKGLARAQIGDRQRTFTVTFPGTAVDESRHAALVAASTEAAWYTVTPTGEELRRDLGDLLRTHDEPIGSTSVYAQYRVMELASAHVKVVLDGQGGDEVFAGYEAYRSYALMPWAVGAIGNTLRLHGFGRTVRHALEAGALLLPVGVKRRLWLRRKAPWLTVARAALGREFCAAYLDAVERWVRDLNSRLLVDITRFSLPQLLRWEDRNAMRFSVESRVPFCDHRLVEYVLQIPACYKVHAGWSKYILRLAVQDLLPKAIVWRRDKLGFATPEIALREALPEFHAAVARWQPLRGNRDFFWWRLFNVLWLANTLDRTDADDG